MSTVATAPEVKSAPAQYKQHSRKGKKAWRKYVDITEVQAGLEDVREQIIQGGVIAEKPSEELFTVDTAGDQEVQKAYNKAHKPLKIDQILSQRSAIPAVDTRKRGNVGDGIIQPSSKRHKSDWVSHKDLAKLKQRAFAGDAQEKDVVRTGEDAVYDPWGSLEEKVDKRFSFLPKEKPAKAPKTIREAPVTLLAEGKQLPAVSKPRGAMSYNPLFQEWDEALNEEGEKEVAAEQRRLEEARADEERQAQILAAQNEREDLLTEDESAWEGFDSDYEGSEWINKPQPDRKTPVERNKAKRRKKAQQEAKHEEAMKKRGQREARAREEAGNAATRLIDSQFTGTEAEAGSSDDDIDDRVLRRRKFGKHQLPERDLELVLPDELQDSLRLLKPEGNLLKDRFRNMQIQGKLETRKPITQPKKKKRTVTEKWTYKDFTISA